MTRMRSSFSGLKTAVARYLERNAGFLLDRGCGGGLPESVADVLTAKAVRAADLECRRC